MICFDEGKTLEIAGNLASGPAPSNFGAVGDAVGSVVGGAANAADHAARTPPGFLGKKKLYDTIKGHIKLAREHHTKITGMFGMQRRKSCYDAVGLAKCSTGVQKKLTVAKEKAADHISKAEGHLKRLQKGSTAKVLQEELKKLKEDHSRVAKQ